MKLFRKLFYGIRIYNHSVIALFANVVLATAAPYIMQNFINILHEGNARHILSYGLLTVLFIPNATYAMLELKHIICKDGIADKRSFGAWIIFGGVSLYGLITSIDTLLIASKAIQFPAVLTTLVLSFLMSLGALIGLRDKISLSAYLNPENTAKTAIKALKHPKLRLLCAGITGLLFCITWVCILYS